jgi:hypothetical protein
MLSYEISNWYYEACPGKAAGPGAEGGAHPDPGETRGRFVGNRQTRNGLDNCFS